MQTLYLEKPVHTPGSTNRHALPPLPPPPALLCENNALVRASVGAVSATFGTMFHLKYPPPPFFGTTLVRNFGTTPGHLNRIFGRYEDQHMENGHIVVAL